MRAFLPLVVLVTAASGCRCSPATPSPVTLRVKNGGRDQLLVNDTKGQLGLTVQRSVGGQWFSFDDLPCECQSCERICERGCRCPDAGIIDSVRAIPPNGQAERQWDGVIQVAGVGCNQVCLVPENAPLDETFRLQLCFVNQIDGVTAPVDGGRVSASFPQPDVQTCVTKEFQPQQGVVEIGPVKGADCTSQADCRGKDELCLSGSCTAGCPANRFPPHPELLVTFTSMGFFSESRDGDAGVVLQTGQGRITAFQYLGEVLQVTLSNAGGTGRVDVKLPGGLGGPSLAVNAEVKALVVIRTVESRALRAVVLRDAVTNELLFAADTAIAGAILRPADVAPFTISRDGDPVGCRIDATCGKLVFSKQKLTSGPSSVSVEPGKLASLLAGSVNYRFWNVTAGQYPASSTCDSYAPWAVWRDR
ncbi:MAG: hypothetical protein JNJ54_22065 [Myxococcaceae bacterium]|nr:hypothetical protein [Myxococcaceae bacterium]